MDNVTLAARGIQKISITDLLEKELQCRTLPSNWKVYPENKDKNYLISGKSVCLNLRDAYHKIDLPSPEGSFLGALIGQFTISGVIREDKSVLAFEYVGRDYLPVAVSYMDDVKKDVQGFIEGQRQEGYATYLHLLSTLLQENLTLTMTGKVKNNSPRLFLPNGLAAKAGELQAVHGFMSTAGEQNQPIYR